MSHRSSDLIESRRQRNASALAAFGVDQSAVDAGYRTVLDGSGPTVYTIGYEKRDGEDVVARLKDAGVDLLLDVRDRPFSRNPDFRHKRLAAICEEAGIEYQSWTQLGSTDHQRDRLRESGDFSEFRKRFRDLMRRTRTDVMAELSDLVAQRTIAMICYERCHDECHRSVLAELLHESDDAEVVAIL